MHKSVDRRLRARIVEPLDDAFKAAGIDPNHFTAHGRNGVTVNGKINALPYDTHSWLWHINVNLFKKAGLTTQTAPSSCPRTATS